MAEYRTFIISFSTMIWKFWIDTGGTFTDCIAIDPDANRHFTKVLSDGSLRGSVVTDHTSNKIHFNAKWGIELDIFKGYILKIGSLKCTILAIDFKKGIIHLDQEISSYKGESFSIAAGEESVILAIRLLTHTTLTGIIPPIDLKLGTTRGTNAILERKGADVTLMVTRGFKDLCIINTQQRPNLFDLQIPHQEVLHSQVIEVDERVSSDGQIISHLGIEHIDSVISKILKKNSLAISLLNAYQKDDHERALKKALLEKGHTHISTSTDLSPHIKYLLRTQTCLINAYLSPIFADYIGNIKTSLPNSSFGLMKSSGGLVDHTLFQPKDSLLSGPSGGLIGAVHKAHMHGMDNILTFDMGGTSTDVARYNEGYDYEYTNTLNHIELQLPQLSIHTVASGGGSICSIEFGKFVVGPESAGAYPGPACYGNGGPYTITDIHLLLGHINESLFPFGLSPDASMKAFDRIIAGATLKVQGMSRQDILKRWLAIADEIMAGAIKKISISKGIDVSNYCLVGYGGAGGLHICSMASLLGIERILLPFEGGLMSAYGIGHTPLESLQSKQILQPLSLVKYHIEDYFLDLYNRGYEELLHQNISKDKICVKQKVVALRQKGQEFSLELIFTKVEDLLEQYSREYCDIFGYLPDETAGYEVENIKIWVSEIPEVTARLPALTTEIEVKANDFQKSYISDSSIPIFKWRELGGGSRISGAALIGHDISTALVQEGWKAQVHQNGDIMLTSISKAQKLPNISQEIITNRLDFIAENMGVMLQRTAISVNIRERLDFSCAILDQHARLVVNAPHIPVHLGSLGICARKILGSFTLNPGDIILTNHPLFGGSHLPDLTLMKGVYTEQGVLIAYVINRAHHAEIGGKTPGSMPIDATTLLEEGVVFPPTYICKKGKYLWEEVHKKLTQTTYPSRSVQENMADLKAAVASLLFGEKELLKLSLQNGQEIIDTAFANILDYSALLLQTAVSSYQGQRQYAQERLDDGSKIAVTITFEEGKIVFDFEGSSAVHPLNLNAHEAIIRSAIMYVLRLLIDKNVPLNEGLLKNVEIKIPNSFLNPTFDIDADKCPAVMGGNTEVSQRVVDTLTKALGISACSQGTMNNVVFGNARFGFYETLGGGEGASEGHEGRSGVHVHMTNTRITDPEDLERRYPVRLRKFEIRESSGGKGNYNGGNGLIREYEFLESCQISVLCQHSVEHPYGMDGGQAGRVGQQYKIAVDGSITALSGQGQLRFEVGDVLRVDTPGGGGWGSVED